MFKVPRKQKLLIMKKASKAQLLEKKSCIQFCCNEHGITKSFSEWKKAVLKS